MATTLSYKIIIQYWPKSVTTGKKRRQQSVWHEEGWKQEGSCLLASSHAFCQVCDATLEPVKLVNVFQESSSIITL